MNLTPEESRILRRQVSAVDTLFRKGLLAVGPGGRVTLTTSGASWIAQDDERIREAKSRGGKKGGPARAEALTYRQLQKIGRMGGRPKKDRAQP